MDDFKHLTEAMHDFVTRKGWYAPNSKRPQTPRNLAISLVLEASEILEHFQWGEECADKAALADELADVMLYLLQLASLHDIDLYQAARNKLARNLKREWE
ncbi:MAG: nucleotide pyrophosphohydrolase [Anaerolineae bacterium]|nr:nucleotide pyrophosphohydrolase [Anaerolineae bacterium]MDW8171930.1 nucleotide pyrophosphohydrolase [Anaerolineae bacterium]